jgi:hypothetical protein
VNSRHADPIMRVLAVYPPGPGLVAALCAYVDTMMAKAKADTRAETAGDVCEGLHPGAPSGVMCRSCHDAETGAPMMMRVLGEMEIAQEEKRRKE